MLSASLYSDVELVRWWNGGAVVELVVDEAVAFDKVQQAKFKTAILCAAGCVRSGGADGAGAAEASDQDAESLVAINRIARTTVIRGSQPVSAVRIEYCIDAELEYEVQAMLSRLTIDSVQRALAQVGLEALPPQAAAPAAQKRNKEDRFPVELKKGVKAACANDPECAYMCNVSIHKLAECTYIRICVYTQARAHS